VQLSYITYQSTFRFPPLAFPCSPFVPAPSCGAPAGLASSGPGRRVHAAWLPCSCLLPGAGRWPCSALRGTWPSTDLGCHGRDQTPACDAFSCAEDCSCLRLRKVQLPWAGRQQGAFAQADVLKPVAWKLKKLPESVSPTVACTMKSSCGNCWQQREAGDQQAARSCAEPSRDFCRLAAEGSGAWRGVSSLSAWRRIFSLVRRKGGDNSFFFFVKDSITQKAKTSSVGVKLFRAGAGRTAPAP